MIFCRSWNLSLCFQHLAFCKMSLFPYLRFLERHFTKTFGCFPEIVYLCTQIIQKRKKIIMIREPIIIDNPSPKALEVIERMKEDKCRDVHSQKHISLARLERESMTVNESEQKLTDVIHRQYNRL